MSKTKKNNAPIKVEPIEIVNSIKDNSTEKDADYPQESDPWEVSAKMPTEAGDDSEEEKLREDEILATGAALAPSQQVTSEQALFGLDQTERIVAVEPDYQAGVWLYRRLGNHVAREFAPFQPWILLTQRPSFALPGAQWTLLDGPGYRHLVEFDSMQSYQESRFRIREAHLSSLAYPAGAKMALIRSGMTLFKGMTFDDVVRLQFDIETEGLNPEPDANRILMIVVSDNRGWAEVIEGDEKEILEQFVHVVQERDPDVMEGHNVYGFDLPFIMTRAAKYGVRLGIGRDGSEPRKGMERNYAIAAGGNTRPFTPVYIYGRHVVDTYLVVQRFDWAKQALTSYGLKECARVFGFAAEGRVELPRERMAELYRDDPELVRTYALQDVIETQRLADLISPVEFYQAQMVPDNYGQVVVTGNGEKINAILVRSYLAAGKAVAQAQTPVPYEGGYTAVLEQGVLNGIVKADVESLYPSLMLTQQVAPASDRLKIFLPCLRDLTQRRLEAKRKSAESNDESHYWSGLQGSFKVLINSFYGYLGGPFNFNDYEAARRVTELGRELVKDVAARLQQSGSTVIEVDTDGVYFVPPSSVVGEDQERAYVAQIDSALQDGIRLAFDGRYATMLSLKTKNYVLVNYDGRKIFKGASLRSRADERYGRRFMTQAVDCLLEHDFEGVGNLYTQMIDDLMNKRLPIEDLVRRERVTEKTFSSENKKRSKEVATGIAIGEHVQIYEKADGTLGLLAHYNGDENTKYYMEKLYKFAKRLEDAFKINENAFRAKDPAKVVFEKYIPKPTAQGLPQQVQTTFEFF